MRLFSCFLLLLISFSATAVQINYRKEYPPVQLSDYIAANQISEQMAQKKQRLIKQPVPISFKGWAMAQPKSGKFELVHDTLSLWGDDAELPKVNYSGFIASDDTPVLSVYVSDEAAKHMQAIGVEKPAIFYAVHIYTYAKGPRLVIVAAEAIDIDIPAKAE